MFYSLRCCFASVPDAVVFACWLSLSHGLGLTTWSPLSSGILTGKYSGGAMPEGSRLAHQDYKVK